ncbi:ArnT family glycosyltransferase [Hylemonella sp. W303a]|uniref:ArnT family glycosyltransferase n=1 Tax=Hylemonella sp. W303a TaxID=3389873 RepID=UPI00396B2465
MTNPAIVAQGAVRRLPRLALWLLCLAYVLPGFIGRTPWKRADITAFGYMAELAAGHTDWLAPRLGGMPTDLDALLPYWLGAWALQLAPDWINPGFAARIPFIGLLVLTLLSVWYGIYHLARSPLAQPVSFAFGGEAEPRDYARALADGGLLAFIACLGLAQLAHETTPAAAQLCFVALSFYAYAALPHLRWLPLISAGIGLTGLTLSGAPILALLLSVGGLLFHALDHAQAVENPARHRHGLWRLAALTVFVAVLASVLDLWHWRVRWSEFGLPDAATRWQSLGRMLLWFTWPVWPFALWTLWRWQGRLLGHQPSRHLSLPLCWALLTVGTTALTPAGDRALLLALPALAALAAFALPTMSRGVTALIDWFTLLFFTLCALFIWTYWIAMQTGVPPQPAANIAKLAPYFEPRFVILPFVFALLGTLVWAWLVKWRIGRHRAALWKSMVLPAGGVTLCWLLLTTLWMPPLDHARSYGPLILRMDAVILDGGAKASSQAMPETAQASCLAWFGLSRAQVAALQYHSRVVRSRGLEPLTDATQCTWLVIDRDKLQQTPGLLDSSRWQRVTLLEHPRQGGEDGLVVLRRLR